MPTVTVTQARYMGNQSGKQTICVGDDNHTTAIEAASQTFAIGAPVTLSSGKVAAASGDAIDTIAGFSLKAATGVTDAKTRYRKIQGEDIYLMNLENNGSPTTTARSDIGKLVNFNVVSGNLQADINPGGSAAVTTKAHGVIIGHYLSTQYPDGDLLGDTSGRVLVRFIDNEDLVG